MQARHEAAVIHITGVPGLARVVADLGFRFLKAVEALHVCVQIQDAWQAQSGADAAEEVALGPAQARGFVHALECCAQHIFTDDLFHAKECGVDPVPAHVVDVGLKPVPAEDA